MTHRRKKAEAEISHIRAEADAKKAAAAAKATAEVEVEAEVSLTSDKFHVSGQSQLVAARVSECCTHQNVGLSIGHEREGAVACTAAGCDE